MEVELSLDLPVAWSRAGGRNGYSSIIPQRWKENNKKRVLVQAKLSRRLEQVTFCVV